MLDERMEDPYEAEERERIEQNRRERLASVRQRMRIISNSAVDDEPEEETAPTEPETTEPSRTDIIRANREQKWLEKVPDKFRPADISTLPPKMRKAAVSWITNQFPHGQNLVLHGNTGGGKSTLAYAIAKELYVGGTVCKIWQTAALMKELRPNEGSRQIFDQVQNAGLLFLDDIGAEKESEWTEEQLFLIIDHRWQYNLPTIVATNLTEDALHDRLSDRIYSRLHHGAEIRLVTGQDYRNTHEDA